MEAKIEVFTSPTCPHCPGAKKAVEEVVSKRDDVSYRELSTVTKEGSEKAKAFQIYSVPTIFIKGPAVDEILAIRGVPSIEKLNELIDISLGLRELKT